MDAAPPDNHDDSRGPAGKRLLLLSLAALGVVYGDIGTSPLYAVRECFHGPHRIAPTETNVLGVLSLIVWSLILVISIKYLALILRADNRGEGGILALAALVTPVKASAQARRWVVVTLGLFGASLLYADGMITPAISVLSAVEGLSVATPFFEPYIVPITVVVLIILFLFQARGTTGIGRVFGPVVLLWFIVLATIGIWRMLEYPAVLMAVNPWYAVEFFTGNGWLGFLVLGTVFLVVTGGEALYADIGHFGTFPIRIAWFTVVLPALLLNYFGQGAFIIVHQTGAQNPFYRMAPEWALYPLVVLATCAAVIASQAVITGAFSLTLQAIQLGYSPRLRIDHMSAEQYGQIYIPTINWALMLCCVGLAIGFRSSSSLAAAYGVAITLTMVITSALFFVLLKSHWNWSLPLAAGVAGFFLLIDLAFFSANITKIPFGGWFPLVVAGIAFLLMSTWRDGRRVLAERLRQRTLSTELFLADLLSNPPMRVPGTAVFMTSNPMGTPPALRHNVMHNKVLHETVVILTVDTAEEPHVPIRNRSEIEEIGEGFYRVTMRYGFMEEPDVPRDLRRLKHPQLRFSDNNDVSYFLGRERLLVTPRPGMARWREVMFVWMSRNSQTATAYFDLPPDRVVEVGVLVEL